MRRMADAAWMPPELPPGCQGLAGYLRSLHPGGPLNPWPAADWQRAISQLRGAPGGFVVPIYLPGPDEDPRQAARYAIDQVRQLGAPPGIMIVLDREAGRGDLDAGWCWTFHDVCVGNAYVPCGYTSMSTANVFAGWSLRWIARPGATALGPGDAMTQYAADVPAGGGNVDLSWVAEGLPVWRVAPPPPPSPKRKATPLYIAHSATREVQVFDTGHTVAVPQPGDGSLLTGAPLGLPYVGPFSEQYIDGLLKNNPQ